MALTAANFALAAQPVWVGPEGAWTHLAGSSHRVSASRHPPPVLASPWWTRKTDLSGNTITFPAQGGAAVGPAYVYATGTIRPASATIHKLFAFSRDTGSPAWDVTLPALPFLDSQSSPAIDLEHGAVIVGVGRFVAAYDMVTGAQRWQVTLQQYVVNASPAVSDDLGKRDRLFITDYPFDEGSTGRLYSINTDTFDAVANPYNPGAIVWEVELGATSGNSPAYLPRRLGGIGLVYSMDYGAFETGEAQPGTAYAFSATATNQPSAAWTAPNSITEGFYGGVAVVPRGASGGPELLASSYAFYGELPCLPGGGLESANTVRHSAISGALLGFAQSNRTSSIPVWLPHGRIVISTGYHGSFYRSALSLELFDTALSPGTWTWDSAMATWTDANANCLLDTGEYTAWGGYVQQPAAALDKGLPRLVVGSMNNMGLASVGVKLSVIDLTAAPSSAGFVVSSNTGAASSPALAGANVYSAGSQGLCAFGPPPVRFDTNGSGRITMDDVYAWEQGQGQRDVDGDGDADALDRAALLILLRCREADQLTEPRL